MKKIQAIIILLIAAFLIIIPNQLEAKSLQFVIDESIEDQYDCSLEIYQDPLSLCSESGWAKASATSTSTGERTGKLYYDYILLEEVSVPVNIKATGAWYPKSYWENPEACGRDLPSLDSFVANECPSVFGFAWKLTLNREDGNPIYLFHSGRYIENEETDIYVAIYSFGYTMNNLSGSCPYGSCYLVSRNDIHQLDAYIVFILNSQSSHKLVNQG